VVEPAEQFVGAIDLGGTNVRAAIIEAGGQIRARARRPTPQTGPEDVVQAMVEALQQAAEEAGVSVDRLVAVGVGAPGPLDHSTGVVYAPPNLAGWDNVPLKQMLQDRLRRPVFVGNDANVAALAERRYGAGKGSDDVIYITVSTGIGGGIVTQGRLLLGPAGTAGEVGHITIDIHGPRCACGNIGCVEALASGPAIARQAQARLRAGQPSMLRELVSSLEDITAEHVVEAARRGDPLAATVMEEAARNIGVLVVNLIHLFNPAVIAIGGGVSNAGELLFGPIRQVVQERALKAAAAVCRIVPAALGDDVGLYGAAAWALDQAGLSAG
jgi:glucokinase